MDVIRGLDKIPSKYECSVVTIGNFDGIHLAHQGLLRKVVTEAADRKCRGVVLTFEPHPQKVLHPERRPFYLLTTLEEKLKLIEGLGIDAVILIEFTPEFAKTSAEQFVRGILWDRLHLEKLIIGHDTAFGNRKTGNETFLRSMGEKLGFDVEAIEGVQVEGILVSSTSIRHALQEGDVRRAMQLLGRPYNLRGPVVKGYRRGSEIGVPTANIASEKELIPARGVYAVTAEMEGRRHPGVLNIGYSPTFGDNRLTVEVHLLDFPREELYGKPIEVFFIDRIRDEVKFENPQQLVRQIERDIERARELLKPHLGAA
ncbi:MAG TPA: bifunctional riboflavin kinase/FAD synthetase [Syntrophales bacterium]|nr:bifunctional riboflavin kinase/FAD synthetase [Syntrophales bacterium]HQL89190.1 bifunctional riboflavin kinase/FAD synthetase [Syntrophales bacterium]